MTGKDLTIVGIGLSLLSGAGAWALKVDRDLGSMGAKIDTVQRDVGEIKATLAQIAPPTVPGKTSTAQAGRGAE